MILERGLRTDKQAIAAAKLLRNDGNFDKILAKGSRNEPSTTVGDSLNLASTASDQLQSKNSERAAMQVKF